MRAKVAKKRTCSIGSRYFSASTFFLLLFAAANAHVEADYAVLIAIAHDGDAAIHIVLSLNNLLRALRNVGGVSEGDVVGELLLDGDLRSVADGIGFGGEPLRIDFDVAGAEEAIEAAADGGVQGLAEDERGGLIGEGRLARLFLKLGRFFVGAAEREKRDDVGFGQRRLRAVIETEAIGGSGDGDVEIVVADVSGGLKVELRLNGDGIGEGDVAALEGKSSAMECGLAFQNIDAAEYGGARDGTAQVKIGVSGEAGDCGAHLKFGSGLNVKIEVNVIEWGVGGGNARKLAAALEVGAEIEARRDGHLVDGDVARDG